MATATASNRSVVVVKKLESAPNLAAVKRIVCFLWCALHSVCCCHWYHEGVGCVFVCVCVFVCDGICSFVNERFFVYFGCNSTPASRAPMLLPHWLDDWPRSVMGRRAINFPSVVGGGHRVKALWATIKENTTNSTRGAGPRESAESRSRQRRDRDAATHNSELHKRIRRR